jgi:transketolase C-terminal domain/subunit
MVDFNDIDVGTPISLVVGSTAEIQSVGGTPAHHAQLAAGLAVNGVAVTNAPAGHVADFALANARGYESSAPAVAPQEPNVKLVRTLNL